MPDVSSVCWKMDRPQAWYQLAEEVIQKDRIVVVLGASDTGKTTLCRFLLQEALGKGLRSAYIDADVGQSVIGPPTTLGMVLLREQRDLLDPVPLCLYFLGATSPAQELLAAVAGARRLLERALELGAEFAVVDTTGLVAGDMGFRLKFYKIEVLSPTDVIAIRRGLELEHILRAFRGRQRPKIHLLPPSRGVQRRDQLQRQLYRSGRFEAYFS
ncbi:MAG: AAA family ATPase, partial [Deltaproteobacteria bacterium]